MAVSEFVVTSVASAPPQAGTLHGFIVIDKPAGWTSHDVVARLRRMLGERHIGHAGTLDPAATGVLPIAVGAATRVLEYLEDAAKTYLAEITFGVETDSHDGDGVVTATADVSGLTRQAIQDALAALLGPQLQVPPMHSAIKVGGRRLYEAARRGEQIERAARPVVFHTLDLRDWRPPVASVLVDCSKGTYVRSLAHDVGAAVGTGAYLSDLVRLRAGPFTLCDAWTLAELADLLTLQDWAALWPEIALHLDVAVEALPAILLDENGARALRQGQRLRPDEARASDAVDEQFVRAYDAMGHLLGIAGWEHEGGSWRPLKVIG